MRIRFNKDLLIANLDTLKAINLHQTLKSFGGLPKDSGLQAAGATEKPTVGLSLCFKQNLEDLNRCLDD